jgi:hypothetical protein
MNGWWGAIGVVVLSVVGIMAAGGSDYRFKTEGEYVSYCTSEMSKAGLPSGQSRTGCKCMYQRGRAALEDRGEYELSESEAEAFFGQCMAPIVAAYEAQAAWDSEGGYSSYSDNSGWAGESSGSSGWGD